MIRKLKMPENLNQKVVVLEHVKSLHASFACGIYVCRTSLHVDFQVYVLYVVLA